MKSFWTLALTGMLFSTIAFSQNPVTEAKIDSLLKLMTLEEKLGQLNQVIGTRRPGSEEQISEEQANLLHGGRIGSFLGIIGAKVH